MFSKCPIYKLARTNCARGDLIAGPSIGRDLTQRGRERQWTTKLQKNYISGSLFTSLCGSLGFCFLYLKLCKQKSFSVRLIKYRQLFCYVLVVPRALKRSYHVLMLAIITSCRCLARCIPSCTYCIYYCSLPSPSSYFKPVILAYSEHTKIKTQQMKTKIGRTRDTFVVAVCMQLKARFIYWHWLNLEQNATIINFYGINYALLFSLNESLIRF